MRKKFLAIMLAVCMIVSLVPAASAATFDDTTGHWSESSVSRWADAGILNGDGTGNFQPDKEMTRAEFAQMLCNLMGYTEKAENTFTDVSDDDWFADAILKLNAAGVMSGVGDGKAAPNAPISREQAAVMLCRALNITPSENASIEFEDGHTVSDWAKDAVAALTERGMINGVGDNNFAPALNINRASVATLVDNMVAEYVTEDGATITGEVTGVVIIKANDVKIENATLSENVIVAPAATDATVTLSGTTQASDVVVSAQGATLVVEETAAASSVTVAAPNAGTQVSGKVDTVAVSETATGAKAIVAENAEVKDVTVAAPNAEAQVAGKVETVAVAETAEGAKAVVGEKAEVKDVTVAAPNAETHVAGKVETVSVTETAEGAKATVATTAEIQDVNVSAPNAATNISGTVSNVAVSETATGANVTATTGAKVDNVSTSAENVTVSGAKDAISNVTASSGSADVKAEGAEVKNDGADKVTVDENTEVAAGDKTTSNQAGNTDKPIEPEPIETPTTPETPSTPDTGDNGGGSGDNGGSTGGGSNVPDITYPSEPDPEPSESEPVVVEADVVAAPLVDQVAEENRIPTEKLGVVTVSGSGTNNVYDITVTGRNIMKHNNANQVQGHWVGFGMPAKAGDNGNYTYLVGEGDTTPSEVTTIAERTYTVGEKTYNTVYFSEDTEEAFKAVKYTIVVKDGEDTVATYNVSFDVTFWKPANEALTVRAFTEAEQGEIGEKGAAAGAVTMSEFTLSTEGGKGKYSGTFSGEVDITKLIHVETATDDSGPVGYYTYYALTMTTSNGTIAKLHDVNNGPGFDMNVTDEFGAIMATKIFDNGETPGAVTSITHNYQLLDKAGRVQYEFDVAITNDCTVTVPKEPVTTPGTPDANLEA